jgi:phosphopantetheinyl transferase
VSVLQEKSMPAGNFKIEPNILDYGQFDVWRAKGNPDSNLLSREELDRLHAISSQNARQTFLLSRCAIISIVKYYTKKCDFISEVHTHPGGKPFLINLPDLHFSLSHTGSEVALVFSRSPVGFDMEKSDRRTDFLALAKRFFTAAELAGIVAAGMDSGSSFLELWTAKEAILKLEGTGISGGLDRARILSESEGDLDGRRVYLHRIEWPGLIGKLASFEKPVAVRTRELILQ